MSYDMTKELADLFKIAEQDRDTTGMAPERPRLRALDTPVRQKVEPAGARPRSIAEFIRSASDIEMLSRMRSHLRLGFFAGKLQPSDKTLAAWETVLWERVFALLFAAETHGQACYIYNVTLCWAKPPHVEAVMWDLLDTVCKKLPSDAERLLAQGVVIEGITKL